MDKLLFFACGALHLVLYPSLPPIVAFAAAGVFLFSVGVFSRFTLSPFDTVSCFDTTGRFNTVHRLVWALSCFCLGASLSILNLKAIIEAQLPQACDRQDVHVVFQINSVPRPNPRAISFDASVVQVLSETSGEYNQAACDSFNTDWLVGKKLKLSWYGSNYRWQKTQPSLLPDKSLESSLQRNQIWQSWLRLKRPRGMVNPKGFDYQAWLLANGYTATGYVKKASRATRLGVADPNAIEHMQNHVRKQLHSLDYARFFLALSLGDKSLISAQDWRTLKSTGVIHLVAISGLHVGFVSWLSYLLALVFVRLCALCPRFQNGAFLHYFPPLCACALALFYAALAGFSIPTLRALLAVGIVTVCQLAGLNFRTMHLILFAVCVVSVTYPLAALNSGFWLSFGAVTALVLAFSGRRRPAIELSLAGKTRQWFVALLKAQIVLGFALILPLWVLAQPISLVASLANIIAVPIVTFVIVPCLLLASALSAIVNIEVVFQLLDQCFHYLWAYLQWLEHGPFAQPWSPLWWPTVAIAWPSVLAMALLTLAFFIPRRVLNPLVPAVIAGIILMSVRPPNVGGIELTALDVGQGLSLVLRSGNQTLVYDTGMHVSDRFNLGERVVAPFLRMKGVREIDLVISHDDADHSGGAQAVAGGFRVNRLLFGEKPSRELFISGDYCVQGHHWRLGHAQLSVLWPPVRNPKGAERAKADGQSHHRGLSVEGNNASCVLLVEYQERRLLLLGDIEKNVEKQLLAEGVLPRDIDVLIAPHHGSKTSSTVGLVNWLRPKYVVFSAGFKNAYRHPNPEVVSRYQAVGSRVLNTATDGAITFVWHDGELTPRVKAERRVSKRPWFD